MIKKWSKDDILYIKDNICNMTFAELAEHFGVSVSSIAHQSSKYKLNKKELTNELWSLEEDNILIEHFQYAPKNMLLKLLPNRTWYAIRQRGNRTLSLKRESQDKYYINYNSFNEWNEFSSYFLGFILADGYIKRNYGVRKENFLQFEIADYDRDILEKLVKYTEFEGPIKETDRNTVRLCIANTKIIDDIINKGIPSINKTYTAKFPDKIPKDFERHFIRGLFDGDGSIYLDENRIVFQLLGTEQLLSSIKSKYDSEFFNNVSIYDRSKCKQSANVFCLKLKGKKAKKILSWMYNKSNIFLNRKYDKYCQLINSPS